MRTEIVSQNENNFDIERHVKRQPRSWPLSLDWPGPPEGESPNSSLEYD